jgi:UDP-N-acetylmuramoylalanine--D-glutamate ligase
VEQVAAKVLTAFRGVPNRLEEVDTLNGVAFYNDSQGTTPVAVQMALQAFAPARPVLIAGGRPKVTDFRELGQMIATRAKAVILIGEAADLIEAAVLAADPAFPVARATSLPEAVRHGYALAAPAGIVLMSPACASFDMFRNMEERGEIFRQAVAALRD